MKIIYISYFLAPSGYAHAARAHARALIEQGVDIKAELHSHDAIEGDCLDDWWKATWPKIKEKDLEGRRIRIQHETPEFFNPDPNMYNIGAVAWETDGIRNRPLKGNEQCNWVGQMNRMNEIWTFSTTSKKAFEDSGVRVPISVFGHPVPHDLFKPSNPIAFREDEMLKERIVFLTVGQWYFRKDMTSILIAYLTEFSSADNVCLFLKTYISRPDKVDEAEQIRKDVDSIRANLKLKDYPPIVMHCGLLPEEQLPCLYSASDCFVYASHGEGFALPVAESMLCERAPISHNWSSMKDYLTDDVSLICDYRLRPVFDPFTPSPWYDSRQNWACIDMMDLKSKMRWAYEHPNKMKEKGKRARQHIIDLYSPEKIGALMKQRLEEVNDRL
jgi:glycosyltransferase involved in cell wall biosynthesis